MKKYFQFVLYFLFGLVTTIAFGQSQTALWKGYFSYNDVSAIAISQDVLVAAAQNSVFSYDISTTALDTYSTIDGLSGEAISTVYSDASYIVLGYSDGLMEIITKKDKSVVTVVDILQKQDIAPTKKRINAIIAHDEKLYIACDFGITVYNLARLEFEDTYFIASAASKVQVRQLSVLNNTLYAATDTGIYKASLSSTTLIDFNQWQKIHTGNWSGLQNIEGILYGVQDKNIYTITDTAVAFLYAFPDTIQSLRVTQEHLIITTLNTVYLYDANFVLEQKITQLPEYTDAVFNDALVFQDKIYIATKQYGVLEKNQQKITALHPDGPLLNTAFSLTATPDNLWVSYGGYDAIYNFVSANAKTGLSHLKEDTWRSIPYKALSEARFLVGVTPDIENPDKVYVSSYSSGLLEIEDYMLVKKSDKDNSPLQALVDVYTLILDNAYDTKGRLWVLNARVDKALHAYYNNQWESYDISSVISDTFNENGYSNLEITPQGYIFFGSSKHGLIGFSSESEVPFFKKITSKEVDLPSDDIRTVALDKNGQLWMGSSRGLRVLYDASNFFRTNTISVAPIIIEEQGIASELLFDQIITKIIVDGSNNKWVATADAGVFYFSEDGQKTLHHFTKDNSPLPTNTVTDIAIDSNSGQVYFATNKGLVSYKGKAIAALDTLTDLYAFPNPVRPEYQPTVTISGLMQDAVVKITDVTGALVYEATAKGGSLQWDLTTFNKHKVASGVYFILASNADGSQTNTFKLLVVR